MGNCKNCGEELPSPNAIRTAVETIYGLWCPLCCDDFIAGKVRVTAVGSENGI